MNQIKMYFGNLVFKKIEPHNENLTVYAARLSIHLGSQERYVLLYVPSDIAISTYGSISSLNWVQLSLAFTDKPPNKKYVIQKQRLIPTSTNRNAYCLLYLVHTDDKPLPYVYMDKDETVVIRSTCTHRTIQMMNLLDEYPYIVQPIKK